MMANAQGAILTGKTKAHNARSAALIQQTTGSLPEFFPKKKEASAKEKAALALAAREAALLLLENPSLELQPLKQEVCAKHSSPFLRNSDILHFIPKAAKHAALRAHHLLNKSKPLEGKPPSWQDH